MITLEGIICKQPFVNSKFEYRNPKQIRNSNALMTKTDVILKAGGFSFGSFVFRSLKFVSNFELRVSDFESGCPPANPSPFLRAI